MLDFEKEEMVKVAAFEKLPKRLENTQREYPARVLCEAEGWSGATGVPALRICTRSGGGGIALWAQHGAPPARSLRSALPCPPWDSQMNDPFTSLTSGGCDIPWPSQQICKGERPNPPCAQPLPS